jgi:ABC-type bacteriocin/lantibiotic exporter with double-glycine peptidase domain
MAGSGKRRQGPVRTPLVVQAQASECGVASLAIVLAYFGRPVPMAELRRVTGVSRDGIGGPDLIRAGRHYGMNAHAYKLEPEAIAARTGFPVIAFLGFMHFAVVEGMDHERVFLNDPGYGRCEMPLEEFREEFTGVIFAFQPGPDFVRSTRQYLLAQLASERPLLLALLGASLAATAGAAAAALALSLALPVLATALFLGASFFARGMQQALSDRLQYRLGLGHTVAAVRQVFRLPFSFHIYRVGPFTHGQLMSHERIAAMLAGEVLPTLAGCVGLPVLLAAMGWVHAPTALAVTALLALYGTAALVLHRRYLPDFFRKRAWALNADNSLQQIATLEMFRSGGMEAESMTSRAAREARYLRHEQGHGEWVSLAAAGLNLAQALLLLAVLALGGDAVRAGGLHGEALVSLVLLAAFCLPLLRRLPPFLRDCADLAMTVPLVAEIGDEVPEGSAVEVGVAPPAPDAILALREVTFGYAGLRAPLLKDLSLQLPPGQQIGITGPSGCGKSTLAGLLVGLYQPWRGAVELGGRPMTELPRSVLARHVAWVGRSPLLFEGTVRDNLRLGDPDIRDADLAAAVADAGLDSVLAQRTGELDAPVSGRGLNFSGGQRQRLELARALARNPRVVILDEALEALEPRLEQFIRERLRRRGCAVLVVSHRASSLAACDRVLLLKDGALVERIAATAPPAPTHETTPFPPEAAAPDRSRREALIRALSRVAEASGLPPIQQRLATAPRDAQDVPALARHAGVAAYAMRFVQDQWWLQDHGPLLAFTLDNDQPCVILPASAGNQIFDPASGKRSRLDARAAAGLHRVAYTLLPLLPDGVNQTRSMLRSALRGCAAEGWTVLLATPVAALLALAPALVVQRLLAAESGTVLLLAWLALAATAALLLDWARGNALLRAEGRMRLRLGVALWARLLRLPQAWLRALPVTEVARRLGAINRLAAAIGSERLIDLCSAALAVAAIALLIGLQSPLAGPVAASATLLALVPALIAWRQRPASRERDRQATQNSALLFDAVQGIAQLRCCGAESRLVERWAQAYAREQALEHQLRGARGIESVCVDFAPVLAVGLLTLVATAGMALPALLSGAILSLIALPAAAATGRGLAALVRGRSALAPLAELLAQPLEPTPDADAVAADAPLSGHIELRGVSFGFSDVAMPVLREVSLTVKPGQIVALVGPSGGGKSTLLRLLLGFETPAAGEILYDGVALSRRGHAAVRRQIGAVLQEEQLWPATVRYNIAHHADSNLEQVWAAAQAAGIAPDIRAMPMEMQTLVDEIKMSTGQKQRIFIAAKLLRRPRILLLDEATSVLHEDLQAQLFASLRRLGITCVSATHRASAVGHADWVYVIDQGRIVQSGPPSELLAQDGPLRTLQAEQATGIYTLAHGVELF